MSCLKPRVVTPPSSNDLSYHVIVNSLLDFWPDTSHSLFVPATPRPWQQNQVSILTNRHSMAAQEGALPQEMTVTCTY
jgi:hypothetical protein